MRYMGSPGLLPVRWTPSLAWPGERLKIHRAEIADGRVSSPRVVEALDVVEHVGAGLVAGAVDAAAHPLKHPNSGVSTCHRGTPYCGFDHAF